MFRNTASQQWVVFAFQDEGGANPGEPVTADQANITANVRIDAGAANAIDDTNPTVLEDGYYSFGITAAESNGDSIVITPVSSTANVNVIGVPGAVYTRQTSASLVDDIWDEVITGVAHNDTNSSGKRLRQTSELGTYSGGRIYINPNGVNSSTDYEDGTDANPVDGLPNALTLSASLNINDFYVTRDTTLAPIADFTNKSVFGNGYTLTLGGWDYAGTHIYHASPLTGTATTSGNADHFDVIDSIVGDVTVDDAHFTRCGFTGTLTLSGVGTGTPGELKMIDCFSLVAGSGTPILDFGTGTENHNVSIANWQNGLQIDNFNVVTTGGTDLLSISGTGQLLISANCDSGTINLRGQWLVTDSSGGAVTITQDDPATSIIAIETDTGTTLQAELDGIQADTEDIQTQIGTAGAGLTNINLPDQTMDITGNLSGSVGSVTGAVGSVTGAVGSVAGNVDGNVTGSVGSNLELGPAEVNTEVDNALNVTTYAEPGQELPASTTTLQNKISYLYKAWRNRSNQTATTYQLYNDDASTVDQVATVSDDATTAEKGEIATGP